MNLPYSFTHIEFSNGIYRANLLKESAVRAWIIEYSAITRTNWRVQSSNTNYCSRFKCRYNFVCHHSGYKRVDQANNKKGKSKNYNCDATIKILIKLTTKDTIKKDKYVKDGFPAVITINDKHSHAVDDSESLSFLRPTRETRQIFEGYFDVGMGIREAMIFHQSQLNFEFPSGSSELANTSINPKYRIVQYWHDIWRYNNLDPRFEESLLQETRTMLTRRQLLDVMRVSGKPGRAKQIRHLYDYLSNHYDYLSHHYEEEDVRHIKRLLRKATNRFCGEIFSKIDRCGRHYDKFLQYNCNWLDKEFTFATVETEETDEPSTSSRDHPKMTQISQPSTSSSGSPSTDPFCREEASCSREEAPATTLELLPEQTDQPDLRPRPPYKGGKDKMYCRLCLKPAYKNSLTPLSVVDFNYPGKSDAFRKKKLEKVEEINKMLKFCLPFYDSLTFNPIICSICLGRLKISYEFSKECLKAQRLVEKYANTYGTIEKVINLNEMIESKFEVFNDENMSDTETEVLDIPKVTSSTSRVSKKRQYSKEDIPPAKKRKEYQEYNIQESHEEDSLTSSNEDASNVKIEPGDDDSCDLTESLKMEPDEDDSFIERVSPNVPESYNIDPNKIDDKTTIKVEPSYIDCPDFIKNEPVDDLQVENKVFSERTGTGTDIEGQVENKALSERTGAGTDIKGERSQFHDTENISLATTNTQTFAGGAVLPHIGPSLEGTTSDVIK